MVRTDWAGSVAAEGLAGVDWRVGVTSSRLQPQRRSEKRRINRIMSGPRGCWEYIIET